MLFVYPLFGGYQIISTKKGVAWASLYLGCPKGLHGAVQMAYLRSYRRPTWGHREDLIDVIQKAYSRPPWRPTLGRPEGLSAVDQKGYMGPPRRLPEDLPEVVQKAYLWSSRSNWCRLEDLSGAVKKANVRPTRRHIFDRHIHTFTRPYYSGKRKKK